MDKDHPIRSFRLLMTYPPCPQISLYQNTPSIPLKSPTGYILNQQKQPDPDKLKRKHLYLFSYNMVWLQYRLEKLQQWLFCGSLKHTAVQLGLLYERSQMVRDVLHTGRPSWSLTKDLWFTKEPKEPGRDSTIDPDIVTNPLLRGPCVSGIVTASSLYPLSSYALPTQRQRMSSHSIEGHNRDSLLCDNLPTGCYYHVF